MPKKPDQHELEIIAACAAKFSNTMNCTADKGLVRLTFGENFGDVKNYHTALVLTESDLLKFATGIINLLTPETKN